MTISGDDTHFLYSSIDLICAQALSADDRIDWFLEQGIPRRALQIAREHSNDLIKHSPKVRFRLLWAHWNIIVLSQRSSYLIF